MRETKYISCTHTYTHAVLVEPVVSNATVNEGDELRLRCGNLNLQGLSVTYWLDPNSQNITSTAQNELSFRNVTRTYTGAYTCVIASSRDKSTVTNTAYVTIRCKCNTACMYQPYSNYSLAWSHKSLPSNMHDKY